MQDLLCVIADEFDAEGAAARVGLKWFLPVLTQMRKKANVNLQRLDLNNVPSCLAKNMVRALR